MRLLHWKLGLKMRCKCSLGLHVQRWNCLKYLLVVSLPTPCAAYSQAFSVRHTRHTEIPIIVTSCISYAFLDNSPWVKSPSIQVEKTTSHLKPNRHEDVFKWSVRALPWKRKTIKAQFVDSK